MNARRVQRVACAVLIGAGVTGVASAAVSATAPPKVLSVAEALHENAAAVANGYGISVAEAEQRLILEQKASEVIESIKGRFQGRYAGSYIEHEPGTHLVVLLTGNQPVDKQAFAANGQTLEVVYRTDAKHSLAQLSDAINDVPRHTEGVPGVLGRYIDERNGQVVIELDSAQMAAKPANLESRARTIASFIGVPVRFEPGERAIVNDVYASGRLDPAGCTTGFTVYHAASNQNGVLTAGHCRETSGFATYTGHASVGGSHLLGNQGWLMTAQADLLWLGNSSVLFGGYFYSNNWYPVTGRRTQGATVTGSTYCKYGITTGYTCGTVQSAYSAPGSPICGPTNSGTCAATFIRIDGPGASTCGPGDSGGPWFTAGTIAAGIHFASNASGSICWYSTTDYAYSGLGLQLLYP